MSGAGMLGMIEYKMRECLNSYINEFDYHVSCVDYTEEGEFYYVKLFHVPYDKMYQFRVKFDNGLWMEYDEHQWEKLNQSNLFIWMWFEEVMK